MVNDVIMAGEVGEGMGMERLVNSEVRRGNLERYDSKEYISIWSPGRFS